MYIRSGCALSDLLKTAGHEDLTTLPSFGSAKTDPVRFKWGFGEGRLKDKFAFFEAYQNPIPKGRKLLARRPFFKAKRALLENPFFKLDRVNFSTPDPHSNYSGRSKWMSKAFLRQIQQASLRVSYGQSTSAAAKLTSFPSGGVVYVLFSERKRHINFFHINSLRPSSPGLSLGQTGFVPGTIPVKSGFHCVN